MPIISANSAMILATYARARTMIIVRSTRSHRVFPLVSSTAAMGTTTANATTQDIQTGSR